MKTRFVLACALAAMLAAACASAAPTSAPTLPPTPTAPTQGPSLTAAHSPSAMPTAVVPSQTSTPAQASPTPSFKPGPFSYSTEPVAIKPGTYSIPKSEWSLVDFNVTFPEDWNVQYGHVYLKHPGTDDEFGLEAVVVDQIYADACAGSDGSLVTVGPSVDDLAAALLEQAGPLASVPVQTTLGGYPATRIHLSVPEGIDLAPCSMQDIGLQIWYSAPADKYFVLLPGFTMSVYTVDVYGQRQVFIAGGFPRSEEDELELQRILDSIEIKASAAVKGWPSTTENSAGWYSWDAYRCAGSYCRATLAGAWMHNGYGSGDVVINVDVMPGGTLPDDGVEAVTVAGHEGFYRTFGAQLEEWALVVEGTKIAIRIQTAPGTSEADLAEARAIVESMLVEPWSNSVGFRLVFRLITADWDSG